MYFVSGQPIRQLVGILIGLLWLQEPALGQIQCADPLTFTPVSQPNTIEWSKFPNFSLPFTIIFGGPRLGDTQASPLQHGFSHIVHVQDSEGGLVPHRQRALDWSGFAYGLGQPWETLQSPWNNDLAAYQTRWLNWLRSVSGGQTDAQGRYLLPAGLLAVDIERFLDSDAAILALKSNSAIPAVYRNLSNDAFVSRYKKDMVKLYAESLRFIRERANLTDIPLMTYSDVPIRNTFVNIAGNTWADWTTNLNRVNYMVKDTTTGQVGGPVYNQLDYIGPSAYYYPYDYPSPLASDYLSYLLFQVEANRAWSSKPIIPYVWMRFRDDNGNAPNFIQPFMAEATAIFPFFSGAKGLYLWDNIGLATTRQDTYTAYEQFVGGLYRLSRFADMFQGNYEVVIETPARDLLDQRQPVWRGVVKDSKILIAAHNPYAQTDAQPTVLTVRYKSWQTNITLTGHQVYLCQFDLNAPVVTAVNEPKPADLIVSPNPVYTDLTVRFTPTTAPKTEVVVADLAGRICLRQTLTTVAGQPTEQRLVTAQLPAGSYILRLPDGQTKRFLVIK